MSEDSNKVFENIGAALIVVVLVIAALLWVAKIAFTGALIGIGISLASAAMSIVPLVV